MQLPCALLSGTAPVGALRRVFQEDAGSGQVGADAVGCRKVAFLARGIALCDPAVDPLSYAAELYIGGNAGIYGRGHTDALL